MPIPSRPPFRTHGVMLLAVGTATLFSFLLTPLIGANTFPIFLVAVCVAAWVGGMIESLTATALSALAILFLFIEPAGSFAVTPGVALRLAAFGLAAGLIGSLTVAFRRTEEARRERERDFFLMVDNVRDFAIFTLHPDGRVATWNEGAEHLLGYRDPEIIGRPFAAIFPPESAEEGPRWELEVARREGRADDERWHVKKDGTRFWASGVLTAIRDDVGRLMGYTKVLRDVTERRRAEVERAELLERERRARAEVEALSRSKDRFLAALSHELRTPLTPVLMAASALEDDPSVPDGAKADLAMISRNVAMEARLIDDLLDLTRIDQGKLGLRREVVDVHALIEQAIGICRREIEAKDLEFAFEPRAANYCVPGDGSRLQQIAWNLLKNAVKFTPPGGHIAVKTDDTGDGRLRVEVRDTGIGIPEEVLTRIFDAFEQGDPEVTHRFGGLGLGLAISRALAEAHGGTLTAASEGVGAGSTFILELVEAAPPSDEECESPVVSEEHPLRPLRILLVEDNGDTARITARMLAASGHTVTTAGSVAEALASGGAHDLLISDLGLPDGSGIDVLRRFHPLPSIALTGYGMEADLRETREAGFTLHLTKPVDFDQLEGAIRRVAGGVPGAGDREQP
ncbi:ATP-binding protein [Tautonia plasticadhaerens]|uniref:histidine kinase n=1 Tax=Tautonia plasticadhaerens TaxID=2527974 RepID=A0A518H388_9BACT|nr:ATP-binding protein [Tautonia plasticadhaerens]QDV35302.1 Aerobic respiration control sensor protein ArcB [Tautonia plasticadhaerens]